MLGELAGVQAVVEATASAEIGVSALLHMRPASITTIVLALRIVESRWAMTKLVRPCHSRAMAS